jgi:hypothetical protein
MRLTALMLTLASRTAAALLTPRSGSFALASAQFLVQRASVASAGACMMSSSAATAAAAGVCCEVIPVPVLNDNYSYLIVDRATNQVRTIVECFQRQRLVCSSATIFAELLLVSF